MSAEVTITRVKAYEYVMPLNRGFGTARGVVRHARNLLVVLEGDRGGTAVVGIGEAAPRSAGLTGDTDEGSWSFLRAACAELQGYSVPLTDHTASIEAIRALNHQFRATAARLATDANADKPFRGTLAGLDMALLDLAARSHDVPLFELLGKHRDEAVISAATISSTRDESTIARKTRSHAHRFPINRIKAKGDFDVDLATMRLVADTNRAAGVHKPLWLDVNEGLDPEAARQLIDRIAWEMKRGNLPRHVIVEQPVAKADGHCLPELQSSANRRLRRPWQRRSPLRLTVMADESIWDESDLERLRSGGGCGAVNIKIQKVGGLLAALELAESARRGDDNVEIYLGGMLGTSDITCWAMKNLAMSMPRLDYFTSVPPGNVQRRIAAPRIAYIAKTSNRLVDQEGPGIGTQLFLPDVLAYVTRAAEFPERTVTSTRPDGPRSNTFDLPHLARFKKLALDSHLLELEALSHGLETMRLSSLIFSARTPGGQQQLGFYWTSTNASSRVGTFVAGNKQITRMVLKEAAVAVPEGEQFDLSHRKPALDYARHLGWPLVVKPQAGTGGVGATTNIRSVEELEWAIDAIGDTRHSTFVVERHIDGNKYRFLVLGDRVLSVINTRPASVIGDGTSTVAELVLKKNLLRRTNPHLRKRPIKVEERTRFQLRRQELDWESVPASGRVVALSTAENLNQGGDSVEVLDETHPTLLDAAVRAVAAIPGLNHAGVDFLIADHREPLGEQSAAICEINSIPASTSHHYPMIGPPRDVSRAILRTYCEQASIPLRDRSDHLCVDMTVRGRVQRVGYRQWMRKLARDLAVAGWVKNTADVDVVEARLAGPAMMVSAIVSLAIAGPASARPELVLTRHHTGDPPQSLFRIRSDDTNRPRRTVPQERMAP